MRAFALLLALAACAGGAPAAERSGTAVVARVVDGDTVDVVIAGVEERVRLLGVDTPETNVEAGPPECFGMEATAYTRGRLPTGTAVRLARDLVGRDDYGRLLAYVYRADDGSLVNEELARLGFARPLWIEPNGMLHDRIVDAARTAEREGLGLWEACRG